MKFAEKLLKHPEFLQLQKRVQEMEQDRSFKASDLIEPRRHLWI